MSIDELFNADKERPKAKPLPRGAARALLRQMLAHQEELRGISLPQAERRRFLSRYHKILRNPIRRPDPFCQRRILPGELYFDVSTALFGVSDEGGDFDWIGTAGARGCGALVLHAYGTQSAPATACLALLKPEQEVDETIENMLACFAPSHSVRAVLAGRDIDLDLAAAITTFLRDEGIKLNAHFGTHAAVAIHIASGDLVASPRLPEPVAKKREMFLMPLFDRFSNPDKPYMRLYYDDRGQTRDLDRETGIDWQPE